MTSSTLKKARLIIQNPTLKQAEEISALIERVYPDMPRWSLDCIKSQITHYPEGQFIALFDKQIVGYSASIRISGTRALKQHSWDEITGNGYCTTHDPEGDYLYGVETCVDNTY